MLEGGIWKGHAGLSLIAGAGAWARALFPPAFRLLRPTMRILTANTQSAHPVPGFVGNSSHDINSVFLTPTLRRRLRRRETLILKSHQ